ncbi:hypothetical protein ACTWP5_10800 [Streptomyces sp. 4N509B]|uniref:hypothetical protein n=1 Tax=Streptomyces sp. 4N509B TaxID=3457413 RepID=UPI003FD4DC0A
MCAWNADWFPVPGAAVFDAGARVSAVSRSEDHLDLFVVGNDNHVWTTFWNAQAGWATDWFPIPGAAVFDRSQTVAAVSRSKDHLDLFVWGYDNHVWTQFWSVEAGGWHGDWVPIAGTAVFDRQPVTAISRSPEHLDLFVMGNDNRVWTQFWSVEAGGWHGEWIPIAGAAVFEKGQQVAAVSRSPEHLDLFVMGNDNHVWSQFWSVEAGGWHGDWFPLPGAAVFDRGQSVAALSRREDRLDLFLVGNDSHVWTTFWDARSGWAADWRPLPGKTVFDKGRPIAPLSRAPWHMDLYLVGNDDHVWTTFWSDEKGWAAEWFPVPGQAVFDRNQAVAAVSRRENQVDLFVWGNDHHVWTTFWHNRKLQFRLRYFVERESTDAFLQGASDEVYVSALGVDSATLGVQPDGSFGAEVVRGHEIGDVSADEVRDPWSTRPHVLMEFDIGRPGSWPRSYTTTLLLIEHDNGDLKGAWGTLYEVFTNALKAAAGEAAKAGGTAAGGPVLGAAIESVAKDTFDVLNNEVREGLLDETFTPIPITINVDDPEHFARHPAVGPELVQRVEQFGGVYDVEYDWHVI